MEFCFHDNRGRSSWICETNSNEPWRSHEEDLFAKASTQHLKDIMEKIVKIVNM